VEKTDYFNKSLTTNEIVTVELDTLLSSTTNNFSLQSNCTLFEIDYAFQYT